MLWAFDASLNAATINTEINHSMTWPTIEKGHGIKYYCSESTTKDKYQGPFFTKTDNRYCNIIK